MRTSVFNEQERALVDAPNPRRNEQQDARRRSLTRIIDFGNEILNIEITMNHSITCFLKPSTLMALRSIAHCGHTMTAFRIRELSVTEILKFAPIKIKNATQAFISGMLSSRTFAEFLLSLLKQEILKEEEDQTIQEDIAKAISLFNGGLRSDHEAFTEATLKWLKHESFFQRMQGECFSVTKYKFIKLWSQVK